LLIFAELIQGYWVPEGGPLWRNISLRRLKLYNQFTCGTEVGENRNYNFLLCAFLICGFSLIDRLVFLVFRTTRVWVFDTFSWIYNDWYHYGLLRVFYAKNFVNVLVHAESVSYILIFTYILGLRVIAILILSGVRILAAVSTWDDWFGRVHY